MAKRNNNNNNNNNKANKKCELCEGEAKTYCESDGARLCWGCDATVHAANFLVAKHRRSLLCRLCLSPTQWSASGPSLSPSLSLCQPCFFLTHNNIIQQQQQQQDHDDHDDDNDDDDDEMSSSEEEEEEEEDEENQVVPRSKPASSSSGLFTRRARN